MNLPKPVRIWLLKRQIDRNLAERKRLRINGWERRRRAAQ